MICYDYVTNKYIDLSPGYNMNRLWYGKKCNITVIGQPYSPSLLVLLYQLLDSLQWKSQWKTEKKKNWTTATLRARRDSYTIWSDPKKNLQKMCWQSKISTSLLPATKSVDMFLLQLQTVSCNFWHSLTEICSPAYQILKRYWSLETFLIRSAGVCTEQPTCR